MAWAEKAPHYTTESKEAAAADRSTDVIPYAMQLVTTTTGNELLQPPPRYFIVSDQPVGPFLEVKDKYMILAKFGKLKS